MIRHRSLDLQKMYEVMNMKRSYRIKLFIILFLTSVIIVTTVSALDYQRLKNQALEDNNQQINQATETVLYALDSVDQAYRYLDQEMNIKMETSSEELQKKYKKNKDFATWDFHALAEKFGMDIYILNKENQIIYSNINEEVGIDFAVCCKSLNKILHERREKDGIFIDAIDLDQDTGEAMKYSYMGTDDNEYIIELGHSLENEPLFQSFNFVNVTEEIVDSVKMIEDMKVLNFGGIAFGEENDAKKPEVRKESFQKARETGEVVEVEQTINNKQMTYRYVPYEPTYDSDGTQLRVVEILYSNYSIDKVLEGNFKTLIVQLLIVFITTGVALFALSHLLSKPIYLAYHDTLTELKNRAAFDMEMKEIIKKQKKNIALFLIDVDDFKMVNDQFGHMQGDNLLKSVAKALEENIEEETQQVYRFGGDEFAVIATDANVEDLSYMASTLIEHVKSAIETEAELVELKTSISVGVAYTAEHTVLEDLFQHADIALYKGKAKGKNQYQIYHEEEANEDPFNVKKRG